jgi:hypothetical protein
VGRGAARGKVPTVDTGRHEIPVAALLLADRLVVAVRSLLLGWGWSEGAG